MSKAGDGHTGATSQGGSLNGGRALPPPAVQVGEDTVRPEEVGAASEGTAQHTRRAGMSKCTGPGSRFQGQATGLGKKDGLDHLHPLSRGNYFSKSSHEPKEQLPAPLPIMHLWAGPAPGAPAGPTAGLQPTHQ